MHTWELVVNIPDKGNVLLEVIAMGSSFLAGRRRNAVTLLTFAMIVSMIPGTMTATRADGDHSRIALQGETLWYRADGELAEDPSGVWVIVSKTIADYTGNRELAEDEFEITLEVRTRMDIINDMLLLYDSFGENADSLIEGVWGVNDRMGRFIKWDQSNVLTEDMAYDDISNELIWDLKKAECIRGDDWFVYSCNYRIILDTIAAIDCLDAEGIPVSENTILTYLVISDGVFLTEATQIAEFSAPRVFGPGDGRDTPEEADVEDTPDDAVIYSPDGDSAECGQTAQHDGAGGEEDGRDYTGQNKPPVPETSRRSMRLAPGASILTGDITKKDAMTGGTQGDRKGILAATMTGAQTDETEIADEGTLLTGEPPVDITDERIPFAEFTDVEDGEGDEGDDTVVIDDNNDKPTMPKAGLRDYMVDVWQYSMSLAILMCGILLCIIERVKEETRRKVAGATCGIYGE